MNIAVETMSSLIGTQTEEHAKNLGDYLDTARRYRKGMAIVFISVFFIGILAAFLIPPAYRSSATILIEEQEIPTDLVRTTVTSYAMKRIEEIKARTLTRSVLLELIQKYGLYEDRKLRETTEELVEHMRSTIFVEPFNAEVVDPRTARPTETVIAFSLAYEGDSPITTQKVTSELTNKFLSENIKSRTESTEETYTFLTVEAEKLNREIKSLEAKLADLKEQYPQSLPELKELNLRLMERTEQQLLTLETDLRALRERKITLEGKLAQTSPLGPIIASSGQQVLDSKSRLKALRIQYLSLTSSYSSDHPDVVRTRREIQGLEQDLGIEHDFTEQAKRLEKSRAELATLRKKYSNEHPDVQRLERTVNALQAEIESLPESPKTRSTPKIEEPDNPIYIGYKSQLDSTVSNIFSMERQQADLTKRLAEYERRLLNTPKVEKEFNSIGREHASASRRYQEIKAKQMEAEVAQQLEKGRKGERFELIEPAQLPEQPVSPNRPVIILIGLMLSIAGGLLYGFGRDSLDTTVHGARGIMLTTGHLPLTSIPRLDSMQETKRKFQTKLLMLIGIIVVIAVIASILHLLWTPLDILYFKALRKLTLLFGI